MSANHDCPLCIENGQVKIIAEDEDFYLVPAIEVAKARPGCYIVAPKQHIESLLEMPGTSMQSLQHLTVNIPGYTRRMQFTLSLSFGEAAGQKGSHVHWEVLRRFGDSDSPSYGMDPFDLVRLCNQIAHPPTALRATGTGRGW